MFNQNQNFLELELKFNQVENNFCQIEIKVVSI